jgi:mannose-6-phosphate isomerase-like protein (cupin superfamily)
MTEKTNRSSLQRRILPVQADTIAPDKSEIRLLAEMEGGGMTHCTLPPYAVSLAGVHETLEEIWYCVQGRGQVWRKNADAEDIVETFPGVFFDHSTADAFPVPQ